ncbi:hypothetical protein BH09MYX1_BH09MYX1_27820 [soil metagenome]
MLSTDDVGRHEAFAEISRPRIRVASRRRRTRPCKWLHHRSSPASSASPKIFTASASPFAHGPGTATGSRSGSGASTTRAWFLRRMFGSFIDVPDEVEARSTLAFSLAMGRHCIAADFPGRSIRGPTLRLSRDDPHVLRIGGESLQTGAKRSRATSIISSAGRSLNASTVIRAESMRSRRKVRTAARRRSHTSRYQAGHASKR